MHARNLIAIVVLLPFLRVPALAKTTQPASTYPASSQPADESKKGKKKSAKDQDEKISTTEHEITIDGEVLKYKATAAEMPMKDEHGKLKANVFFVAYEKISSGEDESAKIDPADRPITFVFNGGPGAAAVWLHLGTAGPRRLKLLEYGEVPGPPHQLVNNEHTWLETTDLVFIDPVGTGFSRAAKGEKREQFYGVKEDINWVADFIRLYVTKYERWLSPVFLAGESYGTTRAAGLSEYLLHRYGIALNGIIFISAVLDFQTIDPGASNDLPYPLYLPTYAATAWHHKRLPADLQANLDATLKEVQQWSIIHYTVALARGLSLTAEQRQKIIQKLARYTTLSPEFIEKSDLRIKPWAFQKQLLADQQKLIGRFDSRITGFDPQPTGDRPSYDPSFRRYLAVYSATFNDYVRRSLKYESVLPYEVLSFKVHPWKYGDPGFGYLSVTDKLRSAMVQNPKMKIMFASGYFDLATPYFASAYTINRLNLNPQLQANISHKYFMGGHMMYHNKADLVKLKTDIATFIRSAL